MMSRLMKQMYCHCFQKLFFLQRTLSWTSEFPLKTLLFLSHLLMFNFLSLLIYPCGVTIQIMHFFFILAFSPPIFLVAKFLMNMLLSFVPECLHLQSVVSTVWGSIWTCTPDCHTIENTCRHALLTDYTSVIARKAKNQTAKLVACFAVSEFYNCIGVQVSFGSLGESYTVSCHVSHILEQ